MRTSCYRLLMVGCAIALTGVWGCGNRAPKQGPSGITGNAQQALTAPACAWATKAPMPTPRLALCAAAVNGIIYAIGGYDGNPSHQSGMTSVEAYNPATNAWTAKAPLHHSRYGLAAAVVNGRIYVFGGYSHSTCVEAYDPATNTWTDMAPMPTGREFPGAAAVNGKIYVMGGYSPAMRTVEIYDPAIDRWTTGPAMPIGVHRFATAVRQGKIYVIGGDIGAGNYTTAVSVLNTETGVWTSGQPVNEARSTLAGGFVGNTIFIAGGARTGCMYVPTVESCNGGGGRWAIEQSMPTARSHVAVAVVDNKIYVIGGSTYDGEWRPVNTVEAYTKPQAAQWTE